MKPRHLESKFPLNLKWVMICIDLGLGVLHSNLQDVIPRYLELETTSSGLSNPQVLFKLETTFFWDIHRSYPRLQ